MDAEFYCFSPTGTGREVARLLTQDENRFRTVEITTPVQRLTALPPRPEALFVLLFPVYARGVPKLVKDWLKRLPPRTGPACLLCTYGSVSAGNALYRAGQLLERKGMTVVGAGELPGPHCYDCAQEGDIPRCAPNWEGVADFFHTVLQRAETAAATPMPALPHTFDPAELIPQNWLARLGVAYPKQKWELCTECGRCKAFCPVDIARAGAEHCIRCGACSRNCHKGARPFQFRLPAPAHYIKKRMQTWKQPRYFL